MRAVRRPGRTLAALGAAIGVAVAAALGAAAQGGRSQVGIVLQFGDGRVLSRCVALPAEGMTGLELLQATGLDLRLKVDGLGALVCGIGEEGCPRDDCLCRCRSGGADCVYWAYHQLAGDRWRYASTGPADRRLGPGDVDGWAWGPGSLSAGTQPPLLSLAEICVVPPSASPSPSAAAATSSPSPGATAPPPAPASSTPPLRRPLPPAATRTRPPSATPAVGAGPRRTPMPLASASSVPEATPTQPPGQSVDPTWAAQVRARMQLATLEAYATALAGLGGTAVARVPGAGEGAGGALADGQGAGPDSRPGEATAAGAMDREAADGLSAAGSGTTVPGGPPPPVDLTRVAEGDRDAGGDAAAGPARDAGGGPDASPWRSGAAPALLLLLVLGWAWWRGRGGAPTR